MWFQALTGFAEENPDQVRSHLVVDGAKMTSLKNGRQMNCGPLETPTLAELRSRIQTGVVKGGELKVSEVVADVQDLHMDPANAHATFQVASQFNLLEMVSPSVTPERGVDFYENDRTQGPACAIACGAGTIYRNYFAEVNGKVGQSASNQIDCLHDLGEAFGNERGRLWHMQNGYALASAEGLAEISRLLLSATEFERDELRQLLRIGIQWDTEVTLGDSPHPVTQSYCSALPVAYSPHPPSQWAAFAQLVLEASYEATLSVATLNASKNGSNKVFLTLLGGGAFGNSEGWILAALRRALNLFRHLDLEVAVVSHGSSRRAVRVLVEAW